MRKTISFVAGTLFLVSPLLVSAQTTEQLQVLIQSLLARIAVLQQQIAEIEASSAAVQQNTTPTPSQAQTTSTQASTTGARCVVLIRNLGADDTDADTNGEVSKLQRFLTTQYGNFHERYVTGYFGPVTEAAVRQWQKEHSLVSSGDPNSTGWGYVGPKTRAAMAEGCGPVPTPQPPQPTTHANCPVYSIPKCPSGQHYQYGEQTYDPRGCPVFNGKCVPDTPSGSLSASPTSGPAPLTVYFQGSGSALTPGASISFGDGVQSGYGETNVSHTYQNPGTYTALLHKDGAKGEVVATKTITVTGSSQIPGVTIIAPNAEQYVYYGNSLTVSWRSSGSFPKGSRACVSLRNESTGNYFAFPPDGGTSCVDVAGAEPTRSVTGRVIRNAGYDLAPDLYRAQVIVTGPSTSEKDGPILAQDQSDVYFKLLDTTTPVPSSSISVTAPNGGEQWEIGQLNTVTWSPYGYNPDVNPAKDVSVYLQRKDGGNDEGFTTIGRIMDTGKASLHTYFNLNDYQTWASPGQYYVLVNNHVTGTRDRSDAPFTLLPRGVDLKVNGSDGPVKLGQNQTVLLNWTSSGVSSCTVNGVRANVSDTSSYGINNLPASSSGYNAYYVGSQYAGAIYITCARLDGSIRGDSVAVNGTDAPTIISKVQVVSPNGGEQLTLGQQKIISFEAQGLKSYSVALYKNDQWLLWLARDVVVANPAIRDEFGYPWTPSEPKYGDDLNNAVYKIYITGQKADGAGYVDDKSDAPFSFIATNPTQTNPVVISSFTAPSPSVAAGQSTTLSWASNLTPSDFETYGGFCGIEGLTTDNRAIQVFNGHKASGSVTVVPDSTTTYTLLCSSGGKDGSPSAQKSVTVSISASPLPTPIVNSFTATPSLITAGQSSKLSWHASNTEYGGCYLFEGSSTQSITPSNNWGGSGSFTVTPSATKSYTIWCTSSWKDGSPTAQKSLTVTVNAPTQSGPTRVHMLGVYEGSYPSGGGHSYGYHPEGTINVALSGFTLTPTVLVLTSYEPVNWIISNPDNVPIQKVMTAGYYAQRVTGINASVPIEHKANLYTYTQGDAKYASILNWLSSVGLPQPSSFSGSYTGANFTIYTGDKGAAPATSNYASASNDTQLANALGALETGLNALLNLLK